MAAKNEPVPCPGNTATALSDGAVTAIRAVSTEDFYLLATLTNEAPTSRDGGYPLLPYQGILADIDLTKVFPGVSTTGPFYVWAWPTSGPATVEVSHEAGA